MKYGDTLQQRSIPQWETHNVDYNDIKHLIKIRTTNRQVQGQAQTIPGTDNEAKALSRFEEELYAELKEQHQRVTLFVQCKAGEIDRRLSHVDKQIALLEKRQSATGKVKIPVRRLEKFAKAEEEILKTGDDIQSLSRFVSAQRLAFHKLLKKYRKWTGSSALGDRFYRGILNDTSNLSKKDFDPLLALWTKVLSTVRAPFVDSSNPCPSADSPEQFPINPRRDNESELDLSAIPAVIRAPKGQTESRVNNAEVTSTRHTSISAHSTFNRPSSSGFSAQQGESSATSAPDAPALTVLKKSRRSKRQRQRRKASEKAVRSRNQRYWNEFDDGSEGESNAPYTIFVDPDARSGFLGAGFLANFFSAVLLKAKESKEKISACLRPSSRDPDPEREPLHNGFASPIDDDDTDNSDTEISRPNLLQQRYSTFPTLPQPPAVHAREVLLVRTCIASFFAAFILIFVASILVGTGRKKAATQVDAGVIIGVTASMVFGIMAVGSLVARRSRVGWIYRTIVLLLFACVFVASGGLISALRSP